MDDKLEQSQEVKKFVARTRSCNDEPTLILKPESTKRKSVNFNEAVKSLDLALGRLKKSKLVNGEHGSVGPVSPTSMFVQGPPDELMDTAASQASKSIPGTENASVMSMNFSHYELMRNLSCSTSNSASTFSSNTRAFNDNSLKNEHLEKFFRSAEMWTRNSSPDNVHFHVPEK